MDKDIEEMMNLIEDEEENVDEERKNQLLKAWHAGYTWLTENEKNSDRITENVANDGSPYNHDRFLRGCNRMEKIEEELNKLGVTDKDFNTQRAVEVFSKPIQ